MNHCDTCGKSLPSDQRNYIEVWFHGKYIDMIKQFYEDRHLHFCSLKCFSVFTPNAKPTQVYEDSRCYLDRRRVCFHPTDRKVCHQQTLICYEMKPERGEWHQLLIDEREKQK